MKMSHLLVILVERLCNVSGLQSVLNLMHQDFTRQTTQDD
jgi:hypothetical protein